jgi:hypothetical protein
MTGTKQQLYIERQMNRGRESETRKEKKREMRMHSRVTLKSERDGEGHDPEAVERCERQLRGVWRNNKDNRREGLMEEEMMTMQGEGGLVWSGRRGGKCPWDVCFHCEKPTSSLDEKMKK